MAALALLLLVASPSLERGESKWVLTNDHLSLTFDLSQGGWLQRLADHQGRVYLEGGAAYTDHGLYPAGQLVTSRGAKGAVLEAEMRPEAIAVVARGRLACGGEPSELAYEQRVTLGSDRTVRVAARLSGERDWPEASGFLATVFSLGGLGEWFAETVDGRVNEVAPDRQRGFQAAQLPLAPEQPTLGLVYTDGRILRATVRARRGPLSNVFLHHTGPGSAALFVAWLDSGATAPWPAGEAWELSLELQAD